MAKIVHHNQFQVIETPVSRLNLILGSTVALENLAGTDDAFVVQSSRHSMQIVGAVHVYPGGVTSIRVMVRATHPYTHIRRMTLAFPVLAGCYAFFLSDTPQRTPLHEAARHGRKEMCALLLKRGAKRDVMDCDANEPGEDSEPTVPENLRRQIRELIES